MKLKIIGDENIYIYTQFELQLFKTYKTRKMAKTQKWFQTKLDVEQFPSKMWNREQKRNSVSKIEMKIHIKIMK